MFNPKTIAVVGATEKQGAVGTLIMENLLRSGQRKVYPVNPNRKSVLGLESHPVISNIQEHIDLAIIVTPAKYVTACVEESGIAGIEGLIIVSAGFRETDQEETDLKEQIKAVRKRYGMRIIGPNAVGLMRPKIGLNASLLRVDPKPGNIAFISQSGALGSAILDWAIKAHIGFSVFASLGSMIDVDFGDLIDFLGDDPYTRSIILYMKEIGHAKKFMSAARGFAQNKPIIVVKPGRFAQSTDDLLSGTDAVAGNDLAYDAAFKRVGVIRVKEVSDIFNTAGVLDSKYLPKGDRLAIVSNAGGFGVMATDALIDSGGKLASISQQSTEELDKSMPPFWEKRNPIDVFIDADLDRFMKSISVCVKDPQVDGVLVVYVPQNVLRSDLLADSIVETARYINKPIIAAWIGGENARKGREILLQNDIPTYETPEDAVRTYLYMCKYRRNLELLYETPAELALDEAPPKFHLKALIRRVLKEGRTQLDEEESKGFLKNYGVPVVPATITHDVESAVSLANRIGYPVVIKIVSSDYVPHKSDVGGIRIGIESEKHLREEYNQLLVRVNAVAPHLRLTGIALERMLESIDYELTLRAKKDKDFGSVILFGMGGIGAEVFKDISIALPPLNQTLARRLMEETVVFRVLQGYRGRAPADIKQLEQIMVSFSNLIVDFPEIVEIDISPLAISNSKAFAVDARIVIEEESAGYIGQYPHLVITPYPTRYTMTWKMKDGVEVTLRPIRPEDEPLEFEMLSTLSEETVRTRFFSIIKDITHDMLVRFCNIDYDREMAIVAELKQEDRKRIVAIGRLIIESGKNIGEYAVLVHDDFHGKGLGYKLVDMLIGVAQDKGLDEIYGIVMSRNERMLRVARKLGFTTTLQPDGVDRVQLALK